MAEQSKYNRMVAKALIAHAGPIIDAIDQYIAKADEDLEKQLKAEGYAEPKETVSEMNSMEEEIADILHEQTNGLVAVLQANEDKDWDTVQDEVKKLLEDDDIAEQVADVALDMYELNVPNLASVYIKESDGALVVNQIRQRTASWFTSWSEKLGELMKINTHKQITDLIQKTIADGDDIASLTRKILTGGWRTEYYQARRVAVTEVLRAHSVAHEEAIQQSPVVDMKEWRHTGSHKNKPRPNHVAMDNQMVPKDQPFEMQGKNGGTYSPMFPRDPILPAAESINCHCIHRGIVNKETLGLSIEERKKMQEDFINNDDGSWAKEQNEKAKAEAGIDVESTSSKADYMSNTVKPKFGATSSETLTFERDNEVQTAEFSLKEVTNSRFDMKADVTLSARSRAIRMAEKNFAAIADNLPEGFSMPKIVVTSYKSAGIGSDAIGVYVRETDTVYINADFNSERAIKKWLTRNEGLFANTTVASPYMHEIGHKHHYDMIDLVAKKTGVEYSVAKQMYEEPIEEYIRENSKLPGSVLQEQLSEYSWAGYSGDPFRKLNETMAEWYTVKDGENPSEIVQLISENERKWIEYDASN